MMFSGTKRKTIIILALVFIYNTFGFLLLQPVLSDYFEHLGLRKAANPSEEDKIEVIVLKKEDMRIKKINFERTGSGEFRLDGDFFDIVKEVERDSLVYFYCLNDEKEDALENEFRERVDENSTNKKQKPLEYNPFKTLATEPVSCLVLSQMNTGNQNFENYNNRVHVQIWGEIPTPPPRSFRFL